MTLPNNILIDVNAIKDLHKAVNYLTKVQFFVGLLVISLLLFSIFKNSKKDSVYSEHSLKTQEEIRELNIAIRQALVIKTTEEKKTHSYILKQDSILMNELRTKKLLLEDYIKLNKSNEKLKEIPNYNSSDILREYNNLDSPR